jgi:sirohydrochlorin cobaltochelatase
VELAYLQLCEPTLDQVLARLSEAGLEEALVIPLFMSGGGHLLRDVPDIVEQAGRRAGLRVRAAGAIAEEPEVVEAMVEAVTRLARRPT